MVTVLLTAFSNSFSCMNIVVFYWNFTKISYQGPINTLRLRQNGRHFRDIFEDIFLNKNVSFPIKISWKLDNIGNVSALV